MREAGPAACRPAQGARGRRAAEPAGPPELGAGRARASRGRTPPASRVDAPTRNYRDASHKPELICALTEFHALVGFREVPQTLALLRALDVAGLAPHVALLAAQPDAAGLRALFTTWITLPQSVLDRAVPALQAACVRLAQEGGEFGREARMALELSERYPGDAGVLAALLLNLVVLQPGEALFLPAGNLHAYLSGAGVELMANSDNVLRGGLTSKHVDVAELLRVLDFTPRTPPVLRGAPDGGWVRYDTDAAEFLLRRFESPADGRTSPSPTAARGSCSARRARRWCAPRAVAPRQGCGTGAGSRPGLWLAADDRDVTVVTKEPGTQLFLAGDGLDI